MEFNVSQRLNCLTESHFIKNCCTFVGSKSSLNKFHTVQLKFERLERATIHTKVLFPRVIAFLMLILVRNELMKRRALRNLLVYNVAAFEEDNLNIWFILEWN